jgi:diguanylate cyclase (GGDEF)-like protein/PAS domain S-box-containing protein
MELESKIHKKNAILIAVLWIIFLSAILINMTLSEIKTVKQVFGFTLFPLLVLTVITIVKKSPKLVKYMIAFLTIELTFILNLVMVHYVHLLLLLVIPILSLVYRDWKFSLINILGSASFLFYLIVRDGERYFVNFSQINVVYLISLLIAFYTILIFEARASYNMNSRLQMELKHIKSLQRELTYNENRYRAMVKQSTEGIYAFNPDTKKIIEASQHFCRMLGYTEAEIRTKTIFDIVYDDVLLIERNIDFSIKQKKKYVGERQYKRKDGSILDVEVRATNTRTEYENVILVNVRDITEKLEKEFELRLSKNILDRILDGVVATNLEGKIVYVNPSFEEITGYSQNEAVGNTLSLVRSYQHDQIFYDTLWKEIRAVGVWEGEIINRKKDGSLFIQRTQIHTIFDEKKQPLLYTSIFRDITLQKEAEIQLKEANQILEELSNLDGLTGMANRRFYDETLDNEWSHALLSAKPLSLIMLDIDHFKIYNDTYGHLKGDECLKQVAKTLKNTLKRQGDFIARYGGEEFSVILPNTSLGGAAIVAENLRSKIESLNMEHTNSKVKPIVTISIGVSSMIPTEQSNPKDLIELADRALYKAKNKGRNQVKVSAKLPLSLG